MKDINMNEVYTLFEEIKELIKKGNCKSTVIQPEIELPDLSVINELTDKFKKTIEEVRKPVRTELYHTFSIASDKVFIGVMGIICICLFCLFTTYYQRSEISNYKNSDLKYRYIKMVGGVTANELNQLENLFDNKQDSIRFIRKQVKEYEKAVVEEAKRLEKARMKELEAEQLKREAEKLKLK
ncbi:MAG: hypothetical protein LUD02_03855 [Tannerellaceae bacterium]|nr:hypothetical protein [Tannerellaceae bacterium]